MSRHMFRMPMLLSMVSLHLLGYSDQNEVKMTFSIMGCYWYKHCSHVITSSVAPFQSLGQDNWNKMLHDTDGIISSTVLFVRSRWLIQDATWLLQMPVLASQDTGVIMNSTIELVSSRWPKWDASWTFSVSCHCWHWHQDHVLPVALSAVPLHSLVQNDFKQCAA